MNWKKITGVVLAGLFGSVLTLGAYKTIFESDSKETVYKIQHETALPVYSSKLDKGTVATLDFTEPAERVMPAVVFIKSTKVRSSRAPQTQVPDMFRDFFGDDFGNRIPNNRPSVGTGSGVIISEDGYIVTNKHVVDGADDIEVSLNDNRNYKAELIGTDPSTDLALLKIEENGLPNIQIANSDGVKVGQWVLAVGNPFNLNSTVTAGIVSAKGRNINILKDRSAIESFIQTDAAINPGNSGGALVNLNGDLIGINTAIASPTGSYSGYGFAIPSNLMRKVITDLMEYGMVQRGYLGVMIRSVDGNLAKEKGLKVTEGVWVDSLLENSAAYTAGMKKGDVILKVDGQLVKSSPALQASIGKKRPGDQAKLTVLRDGREKDLTVILKNKEGNTSVVKAEAKGIISSLGAELQPLSKDKASKLGLKGGVQVTNLRTGKLTRQTNIREGFIITKIDGKSVRAAEEVEKILKGKEGGVLIEGVYEGSGETVYYGFGM
ncbi:MAG: Do family serine endopeptidase [Bacteroidia bacterium]|nr:Do family serine endopeptidase [Bacteroidia bacterium]